MGKKNFEGHFSQSQSQNDVAELTRSFFFDSETSGGKSMTAAFETVTTSRRTLGACGKAIAGAAPNMTKAKKEHAVDFGDVIGKELQNLYDDVGAQPVPDRFLSLLNQLEKNALSSSAPSRAPGERE
jgi:hypothetical protein